ncbi:hypothetical protein D3C87_1754490 [compost metagenome]
MPAYGFKCGTAKCTIGAYSQYSTILVHGHHHWAIKLIGLLCRSFCNQVLMIIFIGLYNLDVANFRIIKMRNDGVKKVGKGNMIGIKYHTKLARGLPERIVNVSGLCVYFLYPCDVVNPQVQT